MLFKFLNFFSLMRSISKNLFANYKKFTALNSTFPLLVTTHKKWTILTLILVQYIAIPTAHAANNTETLAPFNVSDILVNPPKFKNFTSKEGLSNNNIFSITQDPQGFIWIATEDGLNRFDGKVFKQYRHDTNNNNSIIHNGIRKVFIDNQSQLWVGTDNGLSRYNVNLDNFDNFVHNPEDNNSLTDNIIWDIYQDNNNVIWVSTESGLHKFVEKNNYFERASVKGYETRFTEIKTIFQDNKSNYWLGTYDKGIHILNSNLSYGVDLRKKNKFIKISANALFDVAIIEGDYWLATDKGVYIVSPTYVLKKHIINTTTEAPLLTNTIRSISLVNNSQVWLATTRGVNVINLLDYKINSIQKSDLAYTLSENWLMDIYVDTVGRVWMGTYGGGINLYNPLANKFGHTSTFSTTTNFSIITFANDKNGLVYFSTENQGIFSIDARGVIKPINQKFKYYATDLFFDDNNTLWVKTLNNELFKVINDKASELPSWQNNANHSYGSNITLINNNIWFINANGILTSFDLKTEIFEKFPLDNMRVIAFDSQDNELLWLINETSSIFTFDINDKKFSNFHMNNNEIKLQQIRLLKTSKNWIWLGSSSEGITLIHKKNKEVTLYNESNQLNNNFIADILLDDNENAWLSTNNGISVILPKDSFVKNFNDDYSIKNTEFIVNSSLKSLSKHIFFGSHRGFYQLFPSDLLKVSHQNIQKPIFNDFYIANKRISIGQPQKNNEKINPIKPLLLEKQINSLDKITLNYNQSPFGIEFISPNPKLQKQLSYKYRLKGLNDNWIDADNNYLRATYTSLAPDDYVFEVAVFDIFEPKNLRTNNIKIEILPPWWISKSAMSVYSLLALAFVVYFIQQFRHKRQYNLQIQQSEERLKLSLWGSGDEMWDWNITTGKIFRSNIWGVLEFPQDGARNKIEAGSEATATNLHKQDIRRVRGALNEHFDNKTEHFEATYRVKDKFNNWIWILDRGKVVERDADNKPTRMTGTLKDISQIKMAEERLKLFAKCIENIADAVIIYDNKFMAVDVNKSFIRITGKTKEQVLGETMAFHQYAESFAHGVKKQLINKGTWYGEIESLRDNGDLYLADLNIDVIRDDNGSISHFVGVFSDITERKETEKELRTLANSDTLTGLPNRSYFQANQTRLVKGKIPHALLVFDLDNFKKVNDSLGHQVGDALLCKVAQRILRIGGRQNTVYRLGGDEFSIIIENTNDIHTITTLAKALLKTIAEPLKLKNQELVLFGSIGIVLYPEDGLTPHELLKNADTAMYHAKDLGGNRYQFFSESMNKQAVKRLQVESLIRHGLKEDLFSVFYQPKIEIATGKIAGMEALVRFETPSKGIISPIVFIPISEETGQIIDIGEVVLRKSCFATKAWVDAGLFDGRIAVNLSAVQFTQPNLVDMIANILRESQLPAKYLELEITEGTVMNSPQEAINTMHKIREMGIHLSLDDFGTGYSSLAYLKKFPLNTLKIDKAFVDDIEQSEQGRNMVATIVTIAHNLGMHVVAEGVENEQQLNFLSELKCEQLQGYLYSKPLKAVDFKKYLVAHRVTDRSTSFNQ